MKGEPILIEAYNAANNEFLAATGRHIIVRASLRTYVEQEAIYAKAQVQGFVAAPPGKSFHEFGLAIDVNNWEEAEPYLEKYGLINGIAGDMGHFSMGEMSGLGEWRVSTYYTPVKGQVKYFNGSYDRDFYINCSGDCFVTANGHRLVDADVMKAVACPPTMKLGTILFVEGLGVVTCHDRGGAIKGSRLDLWVGWGDTGFNRIGNGSGWKKVYKIK